MTGEGRDVEKGDAAAPPARGASEPLWNPAEPRRRDLIPITEEMKRAGAAIIQALDPYSWQSGNENRYCDYAESAFRAMIACAMRTVTPLDAEDLSRIVQFERDHETAQKRFE